MTCLEARRAIDAAVESPESLHPVASHLVTCARCRSHWEGLQALREELSNWPSATPDDAVLHAIRAEVLQKLAARRFCGPRLGWAALLVVATGTAVTGWKMERRQQMPELGSRLEVPGLPEIDVQMPPPRATESAAPAPRLAKPDAGSEAPPAVRIAAIIPADPETGTAGGVMLELESKNPNVVLYFLAGNQGD